MWFFVILTAAAVITNDWSKTILVLNAIKKFLVKSFMTFSPHCVCVCDDAEKEEAKGSIGLNLVSTFNIHPLISHQRSDHHFPLTRRVSHISRCVCECCVCIVYVLVCVMDSLFNGSQFHRIFRFYFTVNLLPLSEPNFLVDFSYKTLRMKKVDL